MACQCLLQMCLEKKYIDFVLSDGARLEAKVHKDWDTCHHDCLITPLDLKDAYKQLAVHKSERNKAVVALQ